MAVICQKSTMEPKIGMQPSMITWNSSANGIHTDLPTQIKIKIKKNQTQVLFFSFQSIYCYLFHLHLFNAKAKAQKSLMKNNLWATKIMNLWIILDLWEYVIRAYKMYFIFLFQNHFFFFKYFLSIENT